MHFGAKVSATNHASLDEFEKSNKGHMEENG